MSLVEAARRLAAELPSHREAHDARKQLDLAVVGALRDGGFTNCLLPHLLGGAELEPVEYIGVIEALASGDAATGWVAMTASTSAMLGAYLSRATANALWTNSAPLLAGVFAPGGTVDDGKLSGKWSYASGCQHADWFALGALREKRHVVCFVPRASVRIVDNWDTLGLAGTGSHDVTVDGVRVASDHVTSVFDQPPWCDAPLYRVPIFGLLAVGIASCALGVARTALAHAAKRLVGEGNAPSAQVAKYAQLHAELDAAGAYLVTTCADAFERAEAKAVDAAVRGRIRLAAAYATERCAGVVRGAFHIGGGASVRGRHPLQLALRDVETMLTHRMVVDRVLPAAGRALLGIGTPPVDL
jgi:alkylation response protein AidB-like acyl-CoA dehydrogenase